MHYSLRQVSYSIAIFYGILLICDARGIYNWTKNLKVSFLTSSIKDKAEQHWARISSANLDLPKIWLESLFLDFQDAHPLSYPQTYTDYLEQKKRRELRRVQMRIDQSIQDISSALIASRSQPPKTGLSSVPSLKQPRILMIGDSIMAGIGPSLKKEIIDRIDGKVVLHAQIASGLARPDIFDWQDKLEMILSESKFDTILIMLGTNDNQDFVENGSILSYGTTEWKKAYKQRLSRIMQTTCNATDQALWIGLPPMRSASFNRKIIRINNWSKRLSKDFSCMKYVGLENILGDQRGKFVSYQKIGSEFAKVRMTDGIHVTPTGGRLIADYLIPLMSRPQTFSALYE